jgi:hypothetical protein
MAGREPEFLSQLSRHCISRMLPRFDVTSGREPELRTFVIYKKNFATIDDSKV